MARRQIEIPGTERDEHPDIVEKAEKYREVRDQRSEMSKKEAAAKAELLAVMRVHDKRVYKYFDGNGEEIACVIDDEPKVAVKKTGDAESEIGDAIPEQTEGGVHPGLVASVLDEAEAEQRASGVAVNDERDVVPVDDVDPEGKPKTKRKNKR